ncbi:hypothetical protein E2C01_021093 [Portunus trituberculatus]|uniref:Uncharacterized protein n=1 Tax=Portunus trituberculatus TaxID=210409 RepID=A0A5B7E553_PORTR|nr:hypothetical protein [Portunus trituberculatus]
MDEGREGGGEVRSWGVGGGGGQTWISSDGAASWWAVRPSLGTVPANPRSRGRPSLRSWWDDSNPVSASL